MKQTSRRTSQTAGLGRVFPWGILLPGFLASQAFGQTELSLEETVQRALNRSTQVGSAEADLQAQTERKRQAWTNVGPRVSADYTEARYEEALVNKADGSVMRPDVIKTGSLTLAQPVTGLYAAVEYGRLVGLQQDLSAESLRKAKRDAGFGAAENFLQAYQAQEQVVIAEASVAAAKSAFQDAQALFRVGRLSQADQLKFQLALSQAESRLAQAKAARQVTQLVLKQSIQMGPEESLVLKKDLPRIQELGPETPKPELNKNRAELRQAELGSEIARFNKKLVYARYIPSVNLFAKLDRNFGDLTPLSSERETKSYGVKLTWDLWSNGSTFFEIREAASNQLKAEVNEQVAQDAVQLDLTQAYENALAAQESLRLARSAVAQAEEVYRIDQLRFKNGQISATDLIRSESDRSTASGNLVNAETQLLVWHLKLQKAAGADLPQLTEHKP